MLKETGISGTPEVRGSEAGGGAGGVGRIAFADAVTSNWRKSIRYDEVFGDQEATLVLHNINFAIFDNAFGVCLWHCPF